MKKLLFLFCVLQSLVTFAQPPASVEHNFGSCPGFSASVKSTVIQPDGKILIGGEFYNYKGLVQEYLIRLNTDGSKDNSFDIGSGFGSVYSIVLQPDGKIVVGGSFTTFKGTTQNNLIRLNSDGSKDTSFNIGTGFDNIVSAIALQSDGKLLVGGYFLKFQGVTQNYLIRLNADGSKDSSLNIGTGFDSYVYSIVPQPDGKILIGGEFSNYKGNSQGGLVRLNADGSKDTSFNIGYGFGSVSSVVLQPDGKIVVGGSFTTFKGTTQNHLIRLNADGSKDTSFNMGIGFDSTVSSITLQPDGKTLVGGDFTKYQGTIQNKFIRLNLDGSKDNSFDIGKGFNDGVYIIAQQSDGQLILGGGFTTFQGVTQNRLIRLDTNGNKDNSFDNGSGLDNQVLAISQQTDGKAVVGGDFTSFQGTSQNRLIRLNYSGNKDSSFDIGTGFDSTVKAIILQSDGKILVGGHFSYYQGSVQNKLIRLNADGSKDSSFNIGSGFDNDVEAIALQTDGKILVGGWFTSYPGSSSQNKLIRLNADGSLDTTFNIGTGFKGTTGSGTVESIFIQPDGKIIVGGNFAYYNGFSQNCLIRLNPDGSRDSSFNIGSGFNGAVTNIIQQPDGKILAGGEFYIFNGFGQYHLIRLNTDGSKDATFNIGSGASGTGFSAVVESVALQPNGQLLVGGWFNGYMGNTQNKLIRLNVDGSKDNSFDIGSGFENTVYSVILQSDGQILLGGNFTTYQGDNSSAYLIRLNGNYIVTPMIPEITQTNVTCLGGSTGSASVSVYGGKSPYSYLWSNGATTASITGLTSGNYSCTITDADLSTVSKSFTINTDSDTQNPTIVAPAAVTVNTTSNCTAMGVTLGTPVTSDNCSVASIINDAPTAFPLGNTTVTWTVKDASNNTATATQIVTVKGPDATVTNNSGVLSVAEVGASYKWMTCTNVVVPNQTNKTYNPTQVGSYAVEVTKNGCSVTSSCIQITVLGTDDFDMQDAFKLYPNPTGGNVTIDTLQENAQLSVFDVTGRIIFSKELKGGSTALNISNLPIGAYMFRISNDSGTVTKRVIKN